MGIVRCLYLFVRAFVISRTSLVAENLALRQQLAVLKRQKPTPKLKKRDRLFWIVLSKLWPNWQSVLLIVQPQTVIKWQRQGFRLYWRWKSRRKTGRPSTDTEIRKLIRQMSLENHTWGVPRIKSELALLGYDVAESTVAKYMARSRKPPSQNWRTFLENHAGQIAAVDFFTASTVTFRILYVFVILRHSDRKILHFNVTANPTAKWTANQISQAFPYDSAPRFLLRDNDSIYGAVFQRTVESMGITPLRTAYRSPWQNAYVERIIGSVRRECLIHLIVLNEKGLRKILDEYVQYYNRIRPHLSLNRNSPIPRNVEPPDSGKVAATPVLGGLHHHYSRVA